MGHVLVNVTVSNPTDSSLSSEVEAMVDTGATFTVVPESLAAQLRLPVTGRRTVRTATGPLTLDMARALIQMNGEREINRVLISDTVDKVLIGVITLQTFSLTVDPTSGELTEAEAYLL
ncbi:MAG: clan AA aspartic protease [Chloroflexi bacterium]|nr:clan AA aspartic protease [Chloroflexota bacterium]